MTTHRFQGIGLFPPFPKPIDDKLALVFGCDWQLGFG